jgi:hypothetical protein
MSKGVSKKDAACIFELVDKFAGYGYNKSHAAAYALVSYHTAYMKANYREEFLAASMTLDMSNTDMLSMFAEEARKSGITVQPPSVNASEVEFLAEASKEAGKPGAIRYSLAALKNIGASAVATIVEDRKAKGPYKTLADFAARLNPKALNKRGIETLGAAGAFDGLRFDFNAIPGRNAEAFRVGDSHRDGVVHGREHVLQVLVAPVRKDRPCEVEATTRAAARIGRDDDVAPRRISLPVRHEFVAELIDRAAVDPQDRRVPAPGLVIVRLDHEAVDDRAVPATEGDVLVPHEPALREPFVV